MKTSAIRNLIVGGAVLVMMILFSACAGVGSQNLSGSIVAVNPTTHTVVLNVNGQNETISGVPDNVISLLQNQVGKSYTVQVTTNSDGSFSIVGGTNFTPEQANTPEANTTPETNTTTTITQNVQGSIEFFGTVRSTSNNILVVSMPDGSQLPMTTNGTDLGDFNNALPAVNTRVHVKASTNPDGSFNAESLSQVKSDDITSQVTFKGVTTAAVGSDHVIHFAVGHNSYSFTIPTNADLGDFNNNAQSIQNGTPVKVEVQYNGSSATVLKVSNNS